MSRLSTRGLVLRRLPYSDTSQIVWVFTRDYGVVHMIAKGALRLARPASPFPAPFDSASWYDLVLRGGRGDFHLALEGRLVEGFAHLRRELETFLDVELALEVMLKMFSPGDPHPEFLRGALSYFKLLGVGKGRLALRNHFYAFLLRMVGLGPEWEVCSECGDRVAAASVFVRVPRGWVCDSCRRGGEERVSRETVRYLAADAQLGWGQVPAASVGAETTREAWRILRLTLLYHLERPPHSLRYLRDG
ncbi:MAG: DNA repair protein RecO [Planctomycetota bacterium]